MEDSIGVCKCEDYLSGRERKAHAGPRNRSHLAALFADVSNQASNGNHVRVLIKEVLLKLKSRREAYVVSVHSCHERGAGVRQPRVERVNKTPSRVCNHLDSFIQSRRGANCLLAGRMSCVIDEEYRSRCPSLIKT